MRRLHSDDKVSQWLLDAVAVTLATTAGVSIYFGWFGEHSFECRRMAQAVLMFALGGLLGWVMQEGKH